jgi:hypothetical protein
MRLNVRFSNYIFALFQPIMFSSYAQLFLLHFNNLPFSTSFSLQLYLIYYPFSSLFRIQLNFRIFAFFQLYIILDYQAFSSAISFAVFISSKEVKLSL